MKTFTCTISELGQNNNVYKKMAEDSIQESEQSTVCLAIIFTFSTITFSKQLQLPYCSKMKFVGKYMYLSRSFDTMIKNYFPQNLEWWEVFCNSSLKLWPNGLASWFKSTQVRKLCSTCAWPCHWLAWPYTNLHQLVLTCIDFC